MFWNFDIQYARVGTRVLIDLLETLPKIKKVKLIGTVHSKETRDEMRASFKAKGATVLLSEWEQQAEDLELEGK